MDGYGKLFLLLLAIALILVGTSGRGKEAFNVLRGKAATSPATNKNPATQPMTPINPTDLGRTDLFFSNNG